MPTISDQLNAISKQINNITKEASQAAKATRSINESIRIDPTNLALVTQRFQSMQNEIEVTNNRIAALKDAISQLENIRTGTTDEKQLEKINKLIDDYRVKIDYAEKSIERLTAATDKHAQAQAYVNAATQKAEQRFGKLQESANKLSITILALVAVFTRLTNSILEQGQELYSLSQRYNTTVENIQTWNRALQIATGESDLFTQSLQVMVQGMAQVASGRGVAYQTALRQIGIAYSDIAGLDTTEQFQMIVEGLSQVTNASDRAALAQTLLGQSGQYIASILTEDADALDEYLEQASQFGIVSQENAEALNELNLQLEAAKSQLQVAFGEVIVALTPLLQTFADILTNYIAPALESVADWFDNLGKNGQIAVTVLLVIIVLLPKIISLVKGISVAITAFSAAAKTGATAITALNIATSRWQIILLAIAAVIIGIISLFSIFSKSARDATNELTSLVNSANSLTGAGTDFTATTENNSVQMQERTVTMNVDIHGEGDTAISDEAAATVAQLTVEQLNKSLGDLIK